MRRQEYNKLNELIAKNDRIIDRDLFKRYFGYDSLSDMQADLYETRNISANETKVNLIKDKLDIFKKSVNNNMSMNKVNIEKPFKIVDTILKIFKLNKKYQEGEGLKILTTQQMLSRPPISLTQLKAGNNSEKLLYSLYR